MFISLATSIPLPAGFMESYFVYCIFPSFYTLNHSQIFLKSYYLQGAALGARNTMTTTKLYGAFSSSGYLGLKKINEIKMFVVL